MPKNKEIAVCYNASPYDEEELIELGPELGQNENWRSFHEQKSLS